MRKASAGSDRSQAPVPDVRRERCLTLELAFLDRQETDWYYVRVAQENGQWAWTNPIWVAG